MKIAIFTGGTSLRSKNIFTDISLCPTGKHEIIFQPYQSNSSHNKKSVSNYPLSDPSGFSLQVTQDPAKPQEGNALFFLSCKQSISENSC